MSHTTLWNVRNCYSTMVEIIIYLRYVYSTFLQMVYCAMAFKMKDHLILMEWQLLFLNMFEPNI